MAGKEKVRKGSKTQQIRVLRQPETIARITEADRFPEASGDMAQAYNPDDNQPYADPSISVGSPVIAPVTQPSERSLRDNQSSDFATIEETLPGHPQTSFPARPTYDPNTTSQEVSTDDIMSVVDAALGFTADPLTQDRFPDEEPRGPLDDFIFVPPRDPSEPELPALVAPYDSEPTAPTEKAVDHQPSIIAEAVEEIESGKVPIAAIKTDRQIMVKGQILQYPPADAEALPRSRTRTPRPSYQTRTLVVPQELVEGSDVEQLDMQIRQRERQMFQEQFEDGLRQEARKNYLGHIKPTEVREPKDPDYDRVTPIHSDLSIASQPDPRFISLDSTVERHAGEAEKEFDRVARDEPIAVAIASADYALEILNDAESTDDERKFAITMYQDYNRHLSDDLKQKYSALEYLIAKDSEHKTMIGMAVATPVQPLDVETKPAYDEKPKTMIGGIIAPPIPAAPVIEPAQGPAYEETAMAPAPVIEPTEGPAYAKTTIAPAVEPPKVEPTYEEKPKTMIGGIIAPPIPAAPVIEPAQGPAYDEKISSPTPEPQPQELAVAQAEEPASRAATPTVGLEDKVKVAATPRPVPATYELEAPAEKPLEERTIPVVGPLVETKTPDKKPTGQTLKIDRKKGPLRDILYVAGSSIVGALLVVGSIVGISRMKCPPQENQQPALAYHSSDAGADYRQRDSSVVFRDGSTVLAQRPEPRRQASTRPEPRRQAPGVSHPETQRSVRDAAGKEVRPCYMRLQMKFDSTEYKGLTPEQVKEKYNLMFRTLADAKHGQAHVYGFAGKMAWGGYGKNPKYNSKLSDQRALQAKTDAEKTAVKGVKVVYTPGEAGRGEIELNNLGRGEEQAITDQIRRKRSDRAGYMAWAEDHKSQKNRYVLITNYRIDQNTTNEQLAADQVNIPFGVPTGPGCVAQMTPTEQKAPEKKPETGPMEPEYQQAPVMPSDIESVPTVDSKDTFAAREDESPKPYQWSRLYGDRPKRSESFPGSSVGDNVYYDFDAERIQSKGDMVSRFSNLTPYGDGDMVDVYDSVEVSPLSPAEIAVDSYLGSMRENLGSELEPMAPTSFEYQRCASDDTVESVLASLGVQYTSLKDCYADLGFELREGRELTKAEKVQASLDEIAKQYPYKGRHVREERPAAASIEEAVLAYAS